MRPQAPPGSSMDWRQAFTTPAAIPVLRPHLPSAERLLPYIKRIDGSRIYSNWGPLVTEFEARLARFIGQPPGGVISASSGTAALVGGILAAGGRAAERRPVAVIPALSFVATVSAVEQCGYQAFLADVDADTWMLDPQRVPRVIDLDRVGLVVPVAPFGRPVPQGPWREFSERTGIPVVIDGAASFEGVSTSPGRFTGPVPVAISFHATKSFATGEGGCVVVRDVELAQRVVRALNFGFYEARDSTMASINGKLSEYGAAVGLAELDGWAEKSRAIRDVTAAYDSRIAGTGLSERLVSAPDIASCYVLFRCRSLAEAAGVRSSLSAARIDYRLWYGAGLHFQARLGALDREEALPVTEELARLLLGLPMAPDLPEPSIGAIVEGLEAGVRSTAPRT